MRGAMIGAGAKSIARSTGERFVVHAGAPASYESEIPGAPGEEVVSSRHLLLSCIVATLTMIMSCIIETYFVLSGPAHSFFGLNIYKNGWLNPLSVIVKLAWIVLFQ